ncbi:MAG: cupin domain-containing protein [Candidatus Acidiferrales bacterium]
MDRVKPGKSRLKNDTKLSRRELIAAAPLAAAGLAAAAGAGSLLANPADALQRPQASTKSGGHHETLLPFKFDIEATTGWVGEGGSAKEANVDEFPISQSIAGVSMRLKPGGLRELHWHAIAAEWAYIIEGNVRATVISPNGQAESADFGKGDVWYFPRGHGHALQCLGPGDAHFILVFDDGHFSEFGTFSITDFMNQMPPKIVSRNFNLPESVIAVFPKGEVYITQGKVPPAVPENLRNGDPDTNQFPHKFRLGVRPPAVFVGGTERIVSSVEFPIQTTVSAVLMDLKPGGVRELHWHPNADEWQYVISGRTRVGIFGAHGRSLTDEFSPGQIAFINRGFGHFVENIGGSPAQVLILFNSGTYQEISISTWLAGNPPSIIADNFGMTKEQVDMLPKSHLGILG